MFAEQTGFTYQQGEITYETFSKTDTEYQNFVKRILAIQAYAERLGADEMGRQLGLAPNAISKKRLAKIVYDESSHAEMLYAILEKIGVSEPEAIQIAHGKTSHGEKTESLQGAESVGDSDNQWIDLILNNMLMDRAGSHMVANFKQSSFRPWAEACQKIYVDEQWHKQFGMNEFKSYVDQFGTKDLALPFSKWFVHALNFFGPPSTNTQEKLRRYGIKQKSNQQLRTDYINEVRQILNDLNLDNLILDSIQYTYPCALEK